MGYSCPSSHRRSSNTQCGQTGHTHKAQKGGDQAVNIHAALARSQKSNMPSATGEVRAFLGIVSLVAASKQIRGVASSASWGLA